MEEPESGCLLTTESVVSGESATVNVENSANDASAPKPLKSILKRRKPENEQTEVGIAAVTPADEPPPIVQKPKGGSITAALKMITSISHGSDDEEDETDPKPSAFILEMEKQKDKLPVVVPGAFSFPNRLEGIEVADMDWQSTSSPPQATSFFEQEQIRIKEKKAQKEKIKEQNPTKRTKNKISKGPLTMLTPHEGIIEGIVLINNLPFKVTVEEMVKLLGIWPKGGYNGVKLITDKSALPAGFAYVVVERHSDMMDVLRLSGLDFQGRKIRCSMSDREDLIRDWKSTKKALMELRKSRVIKVAQLPFFIKKSELIEVLDKVKFSEDDIYWSPLRSGQTNSGRGFVVLRSSEDAKAISNEKNLKAGGRKLEISQVHPFDFEKFCLQCKLKMAHRMEDLKDPITEDFDDCSDLNLGEKPDNDITQTEDAINDKPISTNFVVVDVDEDTTSTRTDMSERNSGTSKRKRSRRNGREAFLVKHNNRERDFPNGPPFEPTVFVRMYNVPDKANFDDIRNFFDPVLPAKINKSIGPNMYDIEFYNPEEALRAMRKHTLLMRKNVISLEMLPGPPNPFPPRQFPMPAGPMPPGIGPGPFPPQMVPMGPMPPGMAMSPMGPSPIGPPGPLPMPGLAPPGSGNPMLARGGPMPMPMMAPGTSGPMFGHSLPPMMVPPGPANLQPVAAAGPEPANLPPTPAVETQYMPPPMLANESPKEPRKSSRGRRRSPSPESPIKPKKELIPVPPLPEDFTTYKVPSYKGDTPVGQGVITTMQGYFCQLCNKFYSSRASAKDSHCKTKGHYDRLKQFYQEKKRLRRLAENEVKRR